MFRNGMFFLKLLRYWVGLVVGNLGLVDFVVFDVPPTCPSQFGQVFICPGRSGQILECLKQSPLSPGFWPPVPPCTSFLPFFLGVWYHLSLRFYTNFSIIDLYVVNKTTYQSAYQGYIQTWSCAPLPSPSSSRPGPCPWTCASRKTRSGAWTMNDRWFLKAHVR